mgnify:FL=1|tara:strand:+ start:147898 stop:148317 length:420 start_codon:yes stop_codon:yes gene_type:complete
MKEDVVLEKRNGRFLKSDPVWARSTKGWLFGVFEGLSEGTGIPANVFRVAWFLSLFLFGSGIIFYFILVWLLPIREEYEDYNRPKILGVCHKLAWKNNWDLGLVRVLFFSGFLLSFGLMFLIYLACWMFVPEPKTISYY